MEIPGDFFQVSPQRSQISFQFPSGGELAAKTGTAERPMNGSDIAKCKMFADITRRIAR
jgi:hypothetical protein